jgi:hypothetical protein
MEAASVHQNALKQDNEGTTWWDENRDRVEAQFISLLMAETPRSSYTGPERRSQATLIPDPQDAGMARQQAWMLGISFEEHARRLFHEAVVREEQRIAEPGFLPPRKIEPCQAVEPWRSTSAKSA